MHICMYHTLHTTLLANPRASRARAGCTIPPPAPRRISMLFCTRLLACAHLGPLGRSYCRRAAQDCREGDACAPRRRAAVQRIARMGTDRSPRSSESLRPRTYDRQRPHTPCRRPADARPPTAARRGGAHHRRQRPWRARENRCEEQEDSPLPHTYVRAFASARTRFMASQHPRRRLHAHIRLHPCQGSELSTALSRDRPRSPQAAPRELPDTARCHRPQSEFQVVAW
jgi:hypothetical protein